jgi:hypothetical protein
MSSLRLDAFRLEDHALVLTEKAAMIKANPHRICGLGSSRECSFLGYAHPPPATQRVVRNGG